MYDQPHNDFDEHEHGENASSAAYDAWRELRRDLVEQGLTEDTLRRWPNCAVPDCPNKASLRLQSDKCHGHTLGLPVKPWDSE